MTDELREKFEDWFDKEFPGLCIYVIDGNSTAVAVHDAARAECNQYINDALLNDRAALRLVPLYEAVAPMLASARVPDARKLRLNGNVRQQSFDQGWNACRDAVLAAASQPETKE